MYLTKITSKLPSNLMKIGRRNSTHIPDIKKRIISPIVQESYEKDGLFMSKLYTGIVSCSLDNDKPLAKMAVFFKGGSRCNTYPGASSVHAACATAGLSSMERTGFNMLRTLQSLGVTLKVTANREDLCYLMVGERDCMIDAVSVMASLTSNNTYRYYEFPNELHRERLKAIIESVSPQERMIDMAFKAAFRSQPMANSLYCPEYQLKHLSADLLNEYVELTHIQNGMVVVGSGLDHSLVAEASKNFGLEKEVKLPTDPVTVYLGGDYRIESDGPAHVVVAGEGAKHGSAESFTCSVAAELLSAVPAIKYGKNATSFLLRGIKDTPFTCLKGFSQSYTDTGLLGFYLNAAPADMPTLVSVLVASLKYMTASDSAVAGAKARAKAAIIENYDRVNFTGNSLLYFGKVYDLNDAFKGIDNVTPAAVDKVLKKAFGGKLTVSALGDIVNVPYSDSL